MGMGRRIYWGDLVTAAIILTPRLGSVTTVGFIIVGQVVVSVVLDRVGLLNLPV